MPRHYPPVSFHFLVEVKDLPGWRTDDDVRFSEVGGLSMEVQTEEVPEGGENRFVQKFPGRTRYPELVLKRGLARHSATFEWLRSCMQDQVVTPKDIDVHLLDEQHAPLITWHLRRAYPTRWSVSDLNANSNTVVIESLQLYYQQFTLDGA